MHAINRFSFAKLAYYFFALVFFVAAAYWVIQVGSQGELQKPLQTSASSTGVFEILGTNMAHPIARLLLQMIVVISVGRLVGSLALMLGQPRVIGEMAGGIVLGPSLFGLLFPEMYATVFPANSLGVLQLISQIGLILFMFIVGMELELEYLKKKVEAAVLVSHASIVFPFLLGMLLALFYSERFLPPGVSFTSFSLFFGISMSITAFPVLARILKERDLVRDPMGAVALSCAAVDDISAWCLLALVLAISKASSLMGTLYVVVLSLLYVAVMSGIVRPLLERASYGRFGTMAMYILVLLCSALATELIGIHALFGAFFAGLIMPTRAGIRDMLITRIEDVSLLLLLPLFFAFTGLRTEIGLLTSLDLWLVCVVIVLAAVLGKLGGAAVAGRISGLGWRQAIDVGILMNTRGLMELVVLNIGLDAGLLTRELFTILVMMALITTMMTGPLLDLSRRLAKGESKQPIHN